MGMYLGRWMIHRTPPGGYWDGKASWSWPHLSWALMGEKEPFYNLHRAYQHTGEGMSLNLRAKFNSRDHVVQPHHSADWKTRAQDD